MDRTRELDEVVEAVREQVGEPIDVDREVAVHQEVPESRNRAKPRDEILRQDPELSEPIDRRSVVRNVSPRGGCEMCRDVESVLSAEVESALDDPELLPVLSQLVRSGLAISPESRKRLVERQQVTPDDLDVRSARAHRPKAPEAIRRRWALSILASCGSQSQ